MDTDKQVRVPAGGSSTAFQKVLVQSGGKIPVPVAGQVDQQARLAQFIPHLFGDIEREFFFVDSARALRPYEFAPVAGIQDDGLEPGIGEIAVGSDQGGNQVRVGCAEDPNAAPFLGSGIQENRGSVQEETAVVQFPYQAVKTVFSGNALVAFFAQIQAGPVGGFLRDLLS